MSKFYRIRTEPSVPTLLLSTHPFPYAFSPPPYLIPDLSALFCIKCTLYSVQPSIYLQFLLNKNMKYEIRACEKDSISFYMRRRTRRHLFHPRYAETTSLFLGLELEKCYCELQWHIRIYSKLHYNSRLLTVCSGGSWSPSSCSFWSSPSPWTRPTTSILSQVEFRVRELSTRLSHTLYNQTIGVEFNFIYSILGLSFV